MPRPRSRRTPRLSKELVALGVRLKQIRKQHGLSQKELGKKLGLSQRAISDYECGINRLSSDLLVNIANILRVSISELLGRKQSASADKDGKHWKFVKQLETLTSKDKRAVFRFVEALSSSGNEQRVA